MAEIVDFGLQQHKIKMDSGFSNNGLFAVVGDTARRLEVQLLNSNNAIQDTTGINLRLNAEVAGKLTFVDAVVKDAIKGVYTVNLSNGMFLEPGNWGFQWQITKGTNKISSFPFTVKIGENISEGGVQATNFYFNVEELRLKTVELENRYQTMIDSTTGKDVISAPEIIAARKDKPNLNARLDSFEQSTTAQFQQTNTQLADIAVNPNSKNGLISAMIDAVSEKREIHLYGGVYEIDETLVPTGELTIRGYNNAEIRLTETMENVISTEHKLYLYNVKVNGNNLATNIIESTGELPHLEGVELYNGLGDALIAGIGSHSTPTGNAYLKECYAHHCARGFVVYGNSEETTVFMKDCKTSEIDTLLYYLDTHKKTEVYGGIFKGSAESGTNAGYKVDDVTVAGGSYLDILRGATVGKNVKTYIIKDTYASNCSYAGVSVDTIDEFGVVPESVGSVTGNIAEGCGFSARIQGNGFFLDGNISSGHERSSGAYYILNCEGKIGENVVDTTDKTIYSIVNSNVTFGGKQMTENAYPINTAQESTVNFANVAHVDRTGYVLRGTDDVVFADASNGELVIKLPNVAYFKTMGKEFKIIKVDNTVNHVVILKSGAIGTVNGETAKRITAQYEAVSVVSYGDNYVAF